MKELSIEEKAKRYDEAIRVAKDSFNYPDYPGFIRADVVFPELKENEDEKIRKAIGYAIGQSTHSDGTLINGVSSEEALAWLEKQGEQKLVIEMKTPEESLGIDSDTYNKIVDECIYGEQKPTDKVEPKFRVGDWIVLSTSDGEKVVQIDSIEYFKSGEPRYITSEGRWFGNATKARLWTIQDAKDGDVLVVNNEIFIYVHRKQMYSIAVAQYFVDSAGGFYLDGEFGYTEKGNSIHPATKEQRDLLFQKIKEAGLLKSIKDRV